MGLKPQKLEVLPVGFAISFKVDTENYNQKILQSNLLSLKKLVIALAGPCINLIIIFFLILFYQNANWIYSNLIIFVFNMLFIYPLDGGRILKQIFCIFLGRQKALFLTYIISNVMASILTVLILFFSWFSQNFAYLFALLYLWGLLVKENKRYRIKRNLYKILENNLAIKQDS